MKLELFELNQKVRVFTIIMFAEAKLMETSVEGQNQVELYLFNSIDLVKSVKK